MCQERSSVTGIVLIDGKIKHIRVDKCIRHLPWVLSSRGLHVVACCCGHGKYPLTVVCKNRARKFKNHFDLISGVDIPRDRRFYVKDSEGFYYIPEVLERQAFNERRKDMR